VQGEPCDNLARAEIWKALNWGRNARGEIIVAAGPFVPAIGYPSLTQLSKAALFPPPRRPTFPGSKEPGFFSPTALRPACSLSPPPPVVLDLPTEVPVTRTLTLAAALAAFAPPIAPAAVAAPTSPDQCFYSRDWRGWRAADETTLYARVRLNDIYRIEFKHGCSGLRAPGARLITSSTNGRVCSPIDLDVKVTNSADIGATACIVTGVTRLSPDEVKALPKALLP
jgi:hypothetical protein